MKRSSSTHTTPMPKGLPVPNAWPPYLHLALRSSATTLCGKTVISWMSLGDTEGRPLCLKCQ